MLYNKDWERKSNPVSDLLYKAAALLEKHGHVRFSREDENGSMCFLGAMEAAEHGDVMAGRPDSELVIQAAEAVIQTLGIKPREDRDARYPAVAWNNVPERTGQEVIDAMRLAAHVHSHKMIYPSLQDGKHLEKQNA